MIIELFLPKKKRNKKVTELRGNSNSEEKKKKKKIQLVQKCYCAKMSLCKSDPSCIFDTYPLNLYVY